VPRLEQLQNWLNQQLPQPPQDLAPASSDASFRRYFRARRADTGESLIIMDAPPDKEDTRPWLTMAQWLAEAGVHAPKVYAADTEQGFVLMSDLGTTTFLDALTPLADQPISAARLYADALGSLIAIQRAGRPAGIRDYSYELLMQEMRLFPEWYIGRHLGLDLDEAQTTALETMFTRIAEVNLAEPQVCVHRDYHSRNLMYLADDPLNPGVIDFQDAVYGPISYDLVSLLKDAYISWDEEFILDLLVRYWEAARELGLPVRTEFADFHRDFEWMGIQRHLKVLGIFARLAHRDGKTGYLNDMPRVMQYLRKAVQRYGELRPLLKLLDRIDPQQVTVGYTF
jgi:aminoglycoside/choline kinase family phosphotransferase